MTGSNWMHDWRGLHNHERHVEAAEGVYCLLVHSGCGDWCFPDRYCRCCLLVEFRLLTAERDALKANVVQAIGTDGVAGTACRCAEPVPQCYECGAPATHLHPVSEGMHQVLTCGEHFGVLCCEPLSEPVPQWRRLADAGVRNLAYTHEDPLVVVLRSLSNIANPQKGTTANLARIIAVCEAQVGDGWQADPDAVRFTSDSDVTFNVGFLIDAMGYTQRWRLLGNRAAAWLRDLLKEQS